MNKRRSTILTWIIMIVLAIVIVVGYFWLSSKKHEDNYEVSAAQTEADKIIEKNLDDTYPATPREVVKMYCRILKCYYEDELTADTVQKLALQTRKLFDEELLQQNPEDVYILNLQGEIRDYKENERSITNYQIESASNSVTWQYEERDYARVIVGFTQKEKKKYIKVYEQFILRKDPNGKWRILGWQLTDAADLK